MSIALLLSILTFMISAPVLAAGPYNPTGRMMFERAAEAFARGECPDFTDQNRTVFNFRHWRQSKHFARWTDRLSQQISSNTGGRARMASVHWSIWKYVLGERIRGSGYSSEYFLLTYERNGKTFLMPVIFGPFKAPFICLEPKEVPYQPS